MKIEIQENLLVGMSRKEIMKMMEKKPTFESYEECVFDLEKYFFGIFKKRLYLYLDNNIVRDYYIGIL